MFKLEKQKVNFYVKLVLCSDTAYLNTLNDNIEPLILCIYQNNYVFLFYN